jgi:hypothetical protein
MACSGFCGTWNSHFVCSLLRIKSQRVILAGHIPSIGDVKTIRTFTRETYGEEVPWKIQWNRGDHNINDITSRLNSYTLEQDPAVGSCENMVEFMFVYKTENLLTSGEPTCISIRSLLHIVSCYEITWTCLHKVQDESRMAGNRSLCWLMPAGKFYVYTEPCVDWMIIGLLSDAFPLHALCAESGARKYVMKNSSGQTWELS